MINPPHCKKCKMNHWGYSGCIKVNPVAQAVQQVDPSPVIAQPIIKAIPQITTPAVKRKKGLGFPATGDQWGFQSQLPFSRERSKFISEGNNEKV